MPIAPQVPNNASNDSSSNEPTLEQKFAQLDTNHKKLTQAFTNASNLLSDPTVRSVLEAKQRGEEVVVLPKAELDKIKTVQRPEENQNLVQDLNEIDDNNQLATALLGRTTKAVEEVVSKQLSPLMSRLQAMEQVANQTIAAQVDQQVQVLKQKYRDFDDFQNDMLDIAKVNKGLTVEELYIMAKVRKNSPIVPASGLDSEKPTKPSPAPARITTAPGKQYRGSTGFADLIKNAQGRG